MAVQQLLPPASPSAHPRSLSATLALQNISSRQQRKLGHRQAQVGQVIAIQLLLFELFSSASSSVFILFIKLCSELWCSSSVCSRLRTYGYELSIMTATESNVNMFKRCQAEGCRKGCRVKLESEKHLAITAWPSELCAKML